jgi:hypothetical protein
MEVSNEVIERVLKHLVSPKWNGIVEYKIETDTHNDTGVTYYMIDVIFDIDKYWSIYHAGEYDYAGEMDEEVAVDVRNAMKYLGINKVIIEIFVRDEDGIDISDNK